MHHHLYILKIIPGVPPLGGGAGDVVGDPLPLDPQPGVAASERRLSPPVHPGEEDPEAACVPPAGLDVVGAVVRMILVVVLIPRAEFYSIVDTAEIMFVTQFSLFVLCFFYRKLLCITITLLVCMYCTEGFRIIFCLLFFLQCCKPYFLAMTFFSKFLLFMRLQQTCD